MLALCLLLLGCAAKDETEFVKEISTYPAAASADFTLPEGYTFADETTASIVRSSDGQIIGGILDMLMTEEDLEKSDYDDQTGKYLMSLGYRCEYVSMNADGYKAVRLYITDKDSQDRWETSRCLFPTDGKCYDLWLEINLVTDEERSIIRKSVLGK